MKMVHLRFTNAGYFPKPKRQSDIPDNWSWNGKKYDNAKTCSENWNDPITVNIMSNVLRVLCGDIPVPTLKPTQIERNRIYEELASGAYVKYVNPMVGTHGFPAGVETMQTTKSHLKNSHQKNIKQTFTLYDGSEMTICGTYGWRTFDKTFSRNGMTDGKRLERFIRTVLGVHNIREHMFNDVIRMMSSHWGDEEFDREAVKFLEDSGIGKHLRSAWCMVLFGGVFKYGDGVTGKCEMTHPDPETMTSNNCDFSSPTPLLIQNGIGKVKHIDGELWCPVNDEMIGMISENGGTATILDGGLVDVVEIENCGEDWLESEGFHKILSREDAINACAAMGCGE